MEKAVREQLSNAEKMLKDADKAQKMAYSQLNGLTASLPTEDRAMINSILQKVGKLEKTHDSQLAQNLQNEVQELIRKQRKNAS